MLQADKQGLEDIFHTGQREAQKNERERLGTPDIPQPSGRNPVSEKQDNRRAERAQGKKNRERQPEDRTDFSALPPCLTGRAQTGAGHGHAGKAAGIEHQIGGIDQAVDAKPLRAGKVAEDNAIKESQRLQRQIAAGKDSGCI